METTRLLVLAMLTLAAAAATVRADALAELLKSADAPARFAGHTPAFTVAEQTFTSQEVRGPSPLKLHVIKDGDRYVGVYHPGMGQLDLITTDPTKTPATLKMPARYHWATLLGTRIQTIPWAYGWAKTGQEQSYTITSQGKTVTLVENQTWKNRDGSVRATSKHTVTLALDPVTGYAVTINAYYATREGHKRQPELCNIVPQQLSDPWHSAFDKLVYTPAAGGKPVGWNNNTYIGERTNKDKNLLRIANGGYFAWLTDANGWGQVLTRSTDNGAFFNTTCNVWLDQHNMVELSDKRDANGMFATTVTMRFTGIPPEAVKALEKQTQWLTFEGEKQVIVRLQGEDFEDQPLPVSTTVRGAWGHGLAVAEGVGCNDSKRSLVVQGKEDRKLGKIDFFLATPQIPLESNARYRLEAMVKVEGDAEAFLAADLYDNSPHEDARMKRQQTNAVTAADTASEWKKTSLEFDAGPVGPFIDLRFVVLGKGKAYFDNFKLEKIK